MLRSPEQISDSLDHVSEQTKQIQVRLSNELVQLLSSQLYQSPLKAIEELVVNSYDAEAQRCFVYVPQFGADEEEFIAVFDNGVGMDESGLTNLWQIGRSNKRQDDIERRSNRKQIGKFGIGKLATYTIAEKLTYITKSNETILSVSLDYRQFSSSSSNNGDPVQLSLRTIDDLDAFQSTPAFDTVCNKLSIDKADLFSPQFPSWTLVVLEDLKDKARKISLGRLRWVLKTAMPYQQDFELYLNGERVPSSKEDYEHVVKFQVSELPQKRIDALNRGTNDNWYVRDNELFADSFPSGISGTVILTKQTLYSGKSSDLTRSHGFFIRVRGRLVNEEDPLFGLHPLSYKFFNRLHADIEADDLDQVITAPREGVEVSDLTLAFRRVLNTLFNEAVEQYENQEKVKQAENDRKTEKDRQYIPPRYIEFPTADVLAAASRDPDGGEADDTWFYIDVEPSTDIKALQKSLYVGPRKQYEYRFLELGTTERMVKFDPAAASFTVNLDHPLVKNYYEDGGRTRTLLEDFATAEALLEVYLKESRIAGHVIGEILEQRDALLRTLAKDHPFSTASIAQALRDASNNKYDLEIELVAAARALGFVANHLSGPGQPDGMARFNGYSEGIKVITLEAKSSDKAPELSSFDFAGLKEHMVQNNAAGCLLIAPAYPGGKRGQESAVARRANELRISCWTVELLAEFVAKAETRQLNAQDLLNIVLKQFAPDDVESAVNKLLDEPRWERRELYQVILKVLRAREDLLKDSSRNVDMVAAWVSAEVGFADVKALDVGRALRELAGTSQGSMTIRDNGTIVIHTSLDELERRVTGLTGNSGASRRPSNFRKQS